jgi:hypothetical protein
MQGIDLLQYNEKKVIVTVNLDEANDKGELAVEIEGTVVAANELGLLLKPKGRTQAELIEADKIEMVSYVPEKPKTIKAKSLKVVTHGDARTHLIERHGVTLSWANQATEESALKYHASLDHSDLGHNHDPKPAKSDESADAEIVDTESE